MASQANSAATVMNDAPKITKGVNGSMRPGPELERAMKTMIGAGNCSMVHLLPCGTRVVKTLNPMFTDRHTHERQAKNLRREIAVYRHLPTGHPCLLQMHEAVDDGDIGVSLTLEYMPNATLNEYLHGYTIREFLDAPSRADKDCAMRRRHDSVPLRQRALWCLQATDGIALLHAHDVIHADIKPENMGVDAALNMRIFDLAGSALGDEHPLVLESTRFFMPRKSWSVYGVATDCFALGSSIYHIVPGFRPYDALADDDVDTRFERGEFPDLSGQTPEHAPKPDDTIGMSPRTGRLLFADIIDKCWHGTAVSAAAILADLQREVAETFDTEDQLWIKQTGGF
ncbi:hypothetical protein SCUCBS95973_001769 [Sporothrix curviconia]|uniref:Protein kinase domain-containing protein n=1 Tax=Sporothrix curviconia TaxID=1260050 RepID=A0ABP0B1T0_9PEZI